MKRHSRSRRRVKLEFCRSGSFVSLALLVVIVLSTVALAGLHSAIESERDKEAENRAAVARLEQENQDLEQDIEALGSADSIKEIARVELGLEDPDTVVLIMEEAE